MALSLLSCGTHTTIETARAPASTVPQGDSCFLIVEKLLNSQRLKQFKRRYNHFNDFGRSANRKFIKTISSELADDGHLFFHIENQFLKYLNDKVFRDKQITYGLTVLFQETFYRNVLDDPFLSQSLVIKYADYKGLRFAFTSESLMDETKLLRHLETVYKNSMDQFERKVQTYPFHNYLDSEVEEVQNLKRWFIPGAGRSADRAGAASRVGRSLPAGQIPHFQQNKDVLSRRLNKLSIIHGEIRRRFVSEVESGFMAPSYIEEGEYVLSIEVIDLLRKINIESPNHFENFNRSIQQYFGFSVTKEDFSLILDYVKSVDFFSPAVLQEDTLPLDLGKAIKGLISADIAQKGAEGQYQSMSRLVGIEDPITALERTREGYWIVDRNLRDARDWFLTAINYTGPPDNIDRVYQSGDDILFFPDESLTRFEKKTLVTKLAGYKDPSEFRLVFLPSKFIDTPLNIAENLKSQMVVDAENLEKILRRKLKALIGYKRAKELALAINVRPKTNKRSYEIFVGSKSPVSKRRIRRIVDSIFKDHPDYGKIKLIFLEAQE